MLTLKVRLRGWLGMAPSCVWEFITALFEGFPWVWWKWDAQTSCFQNLWILVATLFLIAFVSYFPCCKWNWQPHFPLSLSPFSIHFLPFSSQVGTPPPPPLNCPVSGVSLTFKGTPWMHIWPTKWKGHIIDRKLNKTYGMLYYSSLS